MNKWIRRANKKVGIGGAATLLIAIALVGQVLGFLRNRLISTNFTVIDPGASDAFFAAHVIPDFFFFTIAAGALGVAFMPVLADKIEQGNKQAVQDITNSLINVSVLAMAVVGFIIFVMAKPFMLALAPNMPAEHLQEAITIMQLISLNPLFFAISGIVTALQQTYGRFFFYAISALFYNSAIIISVYLFKDNLGIVGLGVGALMGGIAQLVIALFGMSGLGFRYRPTIKWKSEDFRFVLRQLPPRSLDQGIDQVNSVVEVNRAQALGTGPVSYYNYATVLMNVPIMLLGNSIATAAFPKLIARLSQGRPDLFRKDFVNILLAMLWLIVPVAVVGFFARGYLARLIFGDVAPAVSLIFGYLTAAIVARTIYAMLSRYFYANKDTITPLLVSVFTIGLNIFLVFNLATHESYGIAGLALAQSIAAATEVAILGIIMIIRDRKVFSPYFWGSVIKIVSVTGFTVVAAFMAVSFLPLNAADRGIVTLGVKLSAIAGATLSVHLLVSLLLGMKEAQAVVQKARQIILKPINIDY